MDSDDGVCATISYVTASAGLVTEPVGAIDDSAVATARPVRRTPAYKGQRHRPGLFWSATTQGHVPYESWLELDRLWLADADPAVTWIAGQPLVLRGTDQSRTRTHVPDFLLRRAGRPLLMVDVKPAKFAELPKVAAVFSWTRRACEVQGWDYEVWTGAPPTLMQNVRAAAVARRFAALGTVRVVPSDPQRMTALAQTWRAGDFGEAAPLQWDVPREDLSA